MTTTTIDNEMSGYAVIIHEPGDHTNIIAEYDDLDSAINCYAETIKDDDNWCRDNEVEGVEIYEWNGDTVAWYSFID